MGSDVLEECGVRISECGLENVGAERVGSEGWGEKCGMRIGFEPIKWKWPTLRHSPIGEAVGIGFSIRTPQSALSHWTQWTYYLWDASARKIRGCKGLDPVDAADAGFGQLSVVAKNSVAKNPLRRDTRLGGAASNFSWRYWTKSPG